MNSINEMKQMKQMKHACFLSQTICHSNMSSSVHCVFQTTRVACHVTASTALADGRRVQGYVTHAGEHG